MRKLGPTLGIPLTPSSTKAKDQTTPKFKSSDFGYNISTLSWILL